MPSFTSRTTRSPAEIRDELQLHSGTIICIDGSAIVAKTKSRLNMPMLAMLCHELNFPDDVVKDAIAKQWPRAKEANLVAYDSTIETAKRQTFEADGKYPLIPDRETVLRGQIGWRNMNNGGAIDALKHNTFGRDNSISGSGFVPKFNPEECTSCGICLSSCPDPGALIWKEGKMLGIDPTYCKGCMRCVEVCPRKGRGLMLPGVAVKG